MQTTETATRRDPALVSNAEEWTRVERAAVAERASAILSSAPRPFIRWAGSKQRLLSQLVEHLPAGYRTYYEPFMGAGSMYFALRPTRAVLNDSCAPLVQMYQTVSTSAVEVYDLVTSMDVLDKEYFYKVRASNPSEPIEAAARFIYLNRAAWNGLYRVNAKGQFNVPYGSPRSANIIDKPNLVAAAGQLGGEGTLLMNGDFESALSGAGEGDLVFLDPPYASSKKRESFVDYNEKLFSWDDQIRLAACAESLRNVGAHVIVTNAYNSSIREMYPSFTEHALVRRSSLAGKVSQRRPVAESLLVS